MIRDIQSLLPIMWMNYCAMDCGSVRVPEPLIFKAFRDWWNDAASYRCEIATTSCSHLLEFISILNARNPNYGIPELALIHSHTNESEPVEQSYSVNVKITCAVLILMLSSVHAAFCT
jgi:hypothetical protein